MESSEDQFYGGLTLSKLNDVCMRKVFELLHLRDLCDAAEVCKRFKVVAEEVFKTVYANKQTFDLLQLVEGNNDFHKKWFLIRSLTEMFLKSAEQLFRNFGPFIEALQLTGTAHKGGMDENELLTLAKNYCPALKELILDNLGNDDEFSTELLPLFGGLEKLSIFNEIGEDVSDSFTALLSDCHNLKYLNVWGVPGTMWLDRKFPQLETLIIKNYWAFHDSNFESFLKLHENLRSLTYDDYDICPSYLGIISRACPKLETFHCLINRIDDFDDEEEGVAENVLQLSKLKSLKNFTFTCATNILNLLVAAFVKEDTPIENLEIVHSQTDSELIVGLSKLKTMKTLKLTQCEMTVEILASVSQHLNRLDNVVVEFVEGFNFDARKTEFSIAENLRMVNTVKKAKKSRKRPWQDYDNILNILNDDCLVEIFKFLKLPDLCIVADVCKSFQRSARIVFQSLHTCVKTEEITGSRTDDKTERSYTDMQLAERLFRNFGNCMQELSLDGNSLKSIADQESLLHMACTYCNPSLLRLLTLEEIRIDCDMRWIRPYLNLFYRLPKLDLHSCRLNKHFGRFLSICEIPIIQVYSHYDSTTEWMNNTFFRLKSLILFDTWQMESTLEEFIKLNGHLLQLVIHDSIISSNIFKTVAEKLPNLQGFYFSGNCIRDPKVRKNVMHLARLKSLKSLTLNCGSFSLKKLIDALLTASTPLSELNICFGKVDMELLDKLNNIETPLESLQLRRVNMKNVSLIDVVKKLPDLNELDIDIKGIVAHDIVELLPFAEKLSKLSIGSERADVQINIATYSEILRIVKGRQKPKKLSICICSPKRHVFVPKNLLWENTYWLQIENEIHDMRNVYVTDSENESNSEQPSEESDEDTVMSDVISVERSDGDSDMDTD